MRRSRSAGDSLNKFRLKKNGKTITACSKSDLATLFLCWQLAVPCTKSALPLSADMPNVASSVSFVQWCSRRKNLFGERHSQKTNRRVAADF